MIVLIPWYIVLCVDDLKSDVECIHCEVKKRADQQDNWLFTAAFCSFFGIISIFQNFTFIYHLSTLWSTLGRSFVSVVFFIIMFIIITLGFVVLGHVYYGSYLLQFSTTPFDFIHFISSIFEGLDYYELALYHPNMTIIVTLFTQTNTHFYYYSI